MRKRQLISPALSHGERCGQHRVASRVPPPTLASRRAPRRSARERLDPPSAGCLAERRRAPPSPSPSLAPGASQPTERWLPRRAATRATLALPVARTGSISTHRALAASQSGDARHPRPPRRSHREHLNPPSAGCLAERRRAPPSPSPSLRPGTCRATSRAKSARCLATRRLCHPPRARAPGDSTRRNFFLIIGRVTKLAGLQGLRPAVNWPERGRKRVPFVDTATLTGSIFSKLVM